MSVRRAVLLASLLVALGACQPQAPAAPDAAAAPPAATTAVAAPAKEAPADAALVLPGDFAESTTVADLERRFGKAYMKFEEVTETDGNVIRSLVLFPADPSRRAYVSFHDSARMEGLASILVKDEGSLWRGKGGVHVGMSFADLRKANGKPFYFSGFDAGPRAWVRDQWSPALDDEDSGLGRLDVAEGEHMYFGVDLGVREGTSPADYPKEDSILSDDPKYPRLGEVAQVIAITAYTSLDDEWE